MLYKQHMLGEHMERTHVIILNNDEDISQQCNELANKMNMDVVNKSDIASFLLALQENYYKAAIMFCDNTDLELLKWIKVIHKVRPKVPLILFSKKINKKYAGRIYEEGIFYLGIRPAHKKILCDILEASFKASNEKANYKNWEIY